ncbi:hypothetical protein QUF74_13315 [Candidatus Halobeggiatoa sp. HSG11]|nr:hypothetical protein [Candidatus Halobeggiatoa sp. HSG11]
MPLINGSGAKHRDGLARSSDEISVTGNGAKELYDVQNRFKIQPDW